MSASVGGECARNAAFAKTWDGFVAGKFATARGAAATSVAMFCWSERDFANAAPGGAVFFCDVSQHFLFAQQPGAHAFSLDAFKRMQGRADTHSGAAVSAAIRAIDNPILLNIEATNSTMETNGRIAQLFDRCRG